MDLGEELPPSARLRAMAAVAIAIAMAVLDSAIANIALPTIARDMASTPAATIWVVNAYQFAVTVSLLPLAFLGDVFSYKRIYMVGLAVFTVASLGCALSPNLPVLVVARVVQGFGGAGIMGAHTCPPNRVTTHDLQRPESAGGAASLPLASSREDGLIPTGGSVRP